MLASQIASYINLGTNYPTPVYQQFVYPAAAKTVNGVPVAGEPTSGQGGVAVFRGTPTPQTVFVNGADQFIVVDASTGPVSLQGGAAGLQLISGVGSSTSATAGLTFTNITASGNAIDFIAAVGGNNLFQTSAGTGNYVLETAGGNDTINTLGNANATVDAGTGNNVINVGTGANLIGSEGYDTITGVGFGSTSAVDTINIGSGQTSINSGGTSFLINDSSPNPLLVTLGSGVDTINYGGAGGGATVGGLNSGLTVTGGVGTITAGDFTTGDGVTITGALSTNVSLKAGADTINGQGDSGNSTYKAGTGSSVILAGVGNDTLIGATGANATATLYSGHGAGTTFQFNYGQSGNDIIAGFKAGDTLSFVGFGANPLAIGAVNGNTFSLSDGTTLTFVNGGVPNSPNTAGIGTIKTS